MPKGKLGEPRTDLGWALAIAVRTAGTGRRHNGLSHRLKTQPAGRVQPRSGEPYHAGAIYDRIAVGLGAPRFRAAGKHHGRASIVDRYVVTVTEDSASGRNQTLTTIRVDLSKGRARVTELTFRATEATSADEATHLPIVDVLLQALSKAGPAKASLVSAAAMAVGAGPASARVASRVPAASSPTKRTSTGQTKQATQHRRQTAGAAQGTSVSTNAGSRPGPRRLRPYRHDYWAGQLLRRSAAHGQGLGSTASQDGIPAGAIVTTAMPEGEPTAVNDAGVEPEAIVANDVSAWW